jgi:Na+/H+ antiporter NhaC
MNLFMAKLNFLRFSLQEFLPFNLFVCLFLFVSPLFILRGIPSKKKEKLNWKNNEAIILFSS